MMMVLFHHILLGTLFLRSTSSFSDELSGELLSHHFPMKQVGMPIKLPFPNNQSILGVGGLEYDNDNNIWTASAENLVGLEVDEKFPLASVPRIYHMLLEFDTGSITFANGSEPIIISPANGLKIEDITLSQTRKVNKNSNRQFWLVSESNSHLVKTTTFLSHDLELQI